MLHKQVCRCAEDQNQEPCEHTDEERTLEGAWCTPELYKALEKGYRVISVQQVWHYDKWTMYNGQDPDSGLFTQYIDTFLRLKMQASGIKVLPGSSGTCINYAAFDLGWPPWVQTEEDKEQFLVEYEQREGIELDPTQIEVNKGLRFIAKLALNSFWGKVNGFSKS